MRKIEGLLLFFILLFSACTREQVATPTPTPKQPSQNRTQASTEIVEFLPGIHLAVGYGITNSFLIEGEEGNLLIDTLESMESAIPLAERFKILNGKSITHIFYTNHGLSHTFGTRAFLDENDKKPQIIAHRSTQDLVDFSYNQLRNITNRHLHQAFGSLLGADYRSSNSMGQRLDIGPDITPGYMRPTRTFEDSLILDLKNRKIEFIHSPGYSGDQAIVWLPKERLLICADNFYKAWPNLSGMGSGSPPVVSQWIRSIDQMRALRPHHLIPSHGFPISGEEEVQDYLTHYRDAIQYVHDYTLQSLSQGQALEDIANEIKLPDSLVDKPFLQETFGTIAQSVIAIGKSYLLGNPQDATQLHTPSQKEKAQRLADLVDGPDKLFKKLKEAKIQRQYEWALELAEALRVLGYPNPELLEIRNEILDRLAKETKDSNARNIYLTNKLGNQQRGTPFAEINIENLNQFSTYSFLQYMAIHLDREAAARENRKVALHFTDTNEVFTIWVRNGIAEVQPGLQPDCEMTVTGPSSAWKRMLLGLESPTIEITRNFTIDGGTRVSIGFFLGLFKTQQQ